jgi:predicted component of type VI protein secretion system
MRIECRGGRYLAFDDGSTYGTTVNEWQLGAKESAVLRDGDLVLMGGSRFRFQIVG